MKTIIFGGSGFLGSHVSEELIKRGHKVTIVDNQRPKLNLLNYKFVKCDILNLKKIKKIISHNSIVYNFAAIADIGDSYLNPSKTIQTNVIGNINILEACRSYKIKRYIFASSIYVYSNQGGFYRASKQSSEIFIEEFSKNYNIPYTILRYGSIYGPRSDIKNGVYKIVHDALKNKKAIYRGTKKAIRSYIYVKDAAKISADVLRKKYENTNVLVTGKIPIKVSQLLIKLKRLLKIKKKLTFLNQTQKGHYDVTPYSTKPKKTIKLFPKKTTKLDNGLAELIKIIKT